MIEMARTVRNLLDELAVGDLMIGQVATRFRQLDWPARPEETESEMWGVVDDPPLDPNSWDAVDADSRLTSTQYATLSAAYRAAQR